VQQAGRDLVRMPQMCGVLQPVLGLDAHGCRMEQLAGTSPGATASRLLATPFGGVGDERNPSTRCAQSARQLAANAPPLTTRRPPSLQARRTCPRPSNATR